MSAKRTSPGRVRGHGKTGKAAEKSGEAETGCAPSPERPEPASLPASKAAATSKARGGTRMVKAKAIPERGASELPAKSSSPPGAGLKIGKSAGGKLRKRAKPGSGVALARFAVGDVVRHRIYPFRGVIFDIDPVFANTEEWWLSIPEPVRPRKNQPFYHLLAENAETEYIAYVSEQNLLPDTTGVPVRHPQVAEYFTEEEDGRYRPVFMSMLN